MPTHRLTTDDGMKRPRQNASSLHEWLTHQYHFAASAMSRSISATDLVHHRKAFGQTIVPKRGSVLASPIIAAYDPDPD